MQRNGNAQTDNHQGMTKHLDKYHPPDGDFCAFSVDICASISTGSSRKGHVKADTSFSLQASVKEEEKHREKLAIEQDSFAEYVAIVIDSD